MLLLFNQINYILKRQCLTSLCSSHQTRYIFIDGMKLQKFNLLEGIKILDLTRIVAGPYCTMLMGDLGADILKIEQPNLGDESRRWGPFLKNSNESSYFIALNRNKKSVCVNLKSSAGQNIVKDLARHCDVLIENYVPGKLEQLGLGYDNLMQIAPQLVYCSITGFGKTGPYKLRSGMDVIAASIGGLLHITGPKDGEPCKNGVAMTDIATGLYAYGSIMAALLQRQITGKGQKIDCNLLSTQVACLINIGSRYLNANQDTQRLGTAHPNIVPYQTFPTADSFITIGAVSNDQFAKLCKKLSLEHLIVDDRFLSNSLRVKNRGVLLKILKDKLVSKTTKQWLTIFEGVSFSYGQVNSIAEVFEDEHIKHSGIVKEIEMNHENVDSIIKVVGPAVQFSASENKVRLPPPRLGQHTVEVLTEFLNYNNGQLEQLIKNGDIQ